MSHLTSRISCARHFAMSQVNPYMPFKFIQLSKSIEQAQIELAYIMRLIVRHYVSLPLLGNLK